MSTAVETQGLLSRARGLALLTIVWNVIEGVVAVTAGVAAGSVALVGFGLDSFIEVFAGGVVLWQLSESDESREQRGLRLIGVSFLRWVFTCSSRRRGTWLLAPTRANPLWVSRLCRSLAVEPRRAIWHGYGTQARRGP